MNIEQNKSLKEFTTFKIGGPARFFCNVENEYELSEALAFSKENKLPIFVLGGGSNILVSDKGFNGLVLKMEMKGVEFEENDGGGMLVMVKAGENWDNFVEMSVKKGLYGLENLSLIPGTVGGAPVQNIGAYGSEVKDTIESVRAFDLEKNDFIVFSNTDCRFEYRDSLFKKSNGRYIIVSVTFKLQKEGKVNISYRDVAQYFLHKNISHPTLAEVRDAVIEIRNAKLPDVKKVGTAGSFFKNPCMNHGQASALEKKYSGLPMYPVDGNCVKVSLAWIIDHVCGYRGTSKGNVGTYKNQALVLVNNGEANAEEVKAFAYELIKAVKDKTTIDIEPEVQYIG